MRTGSPARCARARRPRGYTYLWLLFLMAMMAAGLASIGERTSTAVQRERERELIFRGRAIAQAIASYRAASGVGPARWPASFDDLVEDRRGPATRRHLRRAYTDPYTGEPDWLPVLGADERWRGVRSRSDAPSMIRMDGEAVADPERTPRVSDHVFMAVDAPAAAASRASGP